VIPKYANLNFNTNSPASKVTTKKALKYIQVTQKKGTFEKPNKNCRNKGKLWTEIEPLQLAF
jgi:hypothetical protein